MVVWRESTATVITVSVNMDMEKIVKVTKDARDTDKHGYGQDM